MIQSDQHKADRNAFAFELDLKYKIINNVRSTSFLSAKAAADPQTVNEAHTAIQEQCYFFQLKMAKGDSTSNVSYHVILQMGCLSGLVAIESILLVHPGSSHKAHQELISTKAQ